MSKIVLAFGFFCLVWCLTPVGAVAQIPGDANGDSVVNVADVVYEINYLFLSGPPPEFYECGDPNIDCKIDIADVVYLVNYLFIGGPDPDIVDCHWSEPVNLGEPINSSAGDHSFRMSPDGKMAVWESNRQGSYGNYDIWYSFWDSISGTWSEPQNCGANVNGSPNDLYPSLSPDRKKLYCLLFGRPGGYGDWNVWVSTWDSLNNEWGVVENLGPTINDPTAWSPFISPDGSKLYFEHYGICVSEWDGTSWSDPVGLGSNINTNQFEQDPTITADNRTLYFIRWSGIWYICVSHWMGTDWEPAVSLGSPINDSIGVMAPYVTPDGTKLYFTSYRSGGLGMSDIWVSERIPTRKNRGSSPRSQ
jgi:hypothetical protein